MQCVCRIIEPQPVPSALTNVLQGQEGSHAAMQSSPPLHIKWILFHKLIFPHSLSNLNNLPEPQWSKARFAFSCCNCNLFWTGVTDVAAVSHSQWVLIDRKSANCSEQTLSLSSQGCFCDPQVGVTRWPPMPLYFPSLCSNRFNLLLFYLFWRC